jgi:selenocysteine-specific elongation factor
MPGFTPRDASQLGASGRTILEYCSRREFQPPTLDEISEGTALSAAEIARSLEALRAQGQITLAGGEFLVSRNVLEKLVEKLAGAGGDITVASVRDLTGSSRKYVLPMLEMLDSMGITRRVQDKRILRKTKV